MVVVSIMSLRTGSVNVTWWHERIAYALCLVGAVAISIYDYAMCASLTHTLVARVGAFVDAGQVRQTRACIVPIA